jgi:hypothetical protein
MMPLNPRIYLYGIGIVFIILIGVWVYSLPEHYREQGREEIRLDVAQKSREALLIRNAENKRDKLAQAEINKKVKTDYEKQISDQKISYDKRINVIRNNGGLRLPEVACRESARTPETRSPIRADEIGSYRLPGDIEEGLFGLARQCEQVQTKLTALQSWVRLQGFAETKE